MLGESGSLKTILSKSKLTMPSGEIESIDMASSFTLIKFAMKSIVTTYFSINHGLLRYKLPTSRDGDVTLIPSKSQLNG